MCTKIKFQRNASKFAIFKKKHAYFLFFISSNFNFFTNMNALVYDHIDQGIHKWKMKVARNEEWKKLCGFSFHQNIANFEAFLWNLKFSVNHLFWRCDTIKKTLVEKNAIKIASRGLCSLRSLSSKLNNLLQEDYGM